MEKLALAMSGGVDSSAALIMLKEKYDVTGITLKLHDICGENGLRGSSMDIEDAKAIAAKYNIPHTVLDMRELFCKEILDGFVNGYLCGETPNPCVNCNEKIKFGVLLNKAREMGIRRIATGHYARVEYNEDKGRYLLKKAVANGGINPKDQSYVLYRLTQGQLSAVVFPLGEKSKEEIRETAGANNLVNSKKPDSQDICFVPDGDYGAFIEGYTKKSYPPCIFADKDGNIIGKGKNALHYTVGQRRGIGMGFGRPMYVISKDTAANTVTLGENELLFTDTLYADRLNWIALDNPEKSFSCKAKTRYSQKEQPCTVYPENGRVRVVFDERTRAVTPGQHVVFYDGDTVLGGGVILP